MSPETTGRKGGSIPAALPQIFSGVQTFVNTHQFFIQQHGFFYPNLMHTGVKTHMQQEAPVFYCHPPPPAAALRKLLT